VLRKRGKSAGRTNTVPAAYAFDQRQLVVVVRIWSTTRRRVKARRGNATGFGAGMLDMIPSSARCERAVNIRLG
jgi:hypothetical protein